MEEHIEIHVVEASAIEARLDVVYCGESPAGAALSGTISGPRSNASRTLPATVELKASRAGNAPHAEAILPDPCFWSPELPFLYDISLELRHAGHAIDAAVFSFALFPKRVMRK
jgi:hypothetical protein